MKKLILAGAIAFASAMSYGATATWSVINVQDPAGGYGSTGWLVQVFDTSVDYSYEAAKSGSITALFSATTAAQGTTGMVSVNQSGVGSLSAGDSGAWYAVIYDAGTVDKASHYIVSDDKAWSVNALGKDITVAFGNMTATTTANTFRNSTWQSVPEPTSGLLMLLGVAGLALRRKRA